MNIDPNVGLSSVSATTSHAVLPAADETARELNKVYLKLVADSDQYPWLNSGTRAADFNYSINDLLAVTSLQSQTGRQAIDMITNLPLSAERLATERSVTGSLVGSIEKNAETLNALLQQTAGGAVTFDFIVNQMFTGLSTRPLEGINVENLFVVGLLDLLPHLDALPQSIKNNINTLLEWLGSGAHACIFFATPGAMTEVMKGLVNDTWASLSTIVNNPPFGPGSVIYEVMTLINGGTPPTATVPDSLAQQIANYHDPANGGWFNSSLNGFSPMMRVSMLRDLMGKQALTTAEINTILLGNRAEMDQLLMAKTGKNALDFLVSTGQWEVTNRPSASMPEGITQIIAHRNPLTESDLTNLVTNFPGRELTKEDLREINNIGDQVKMLMQSLKYWLTTMRDEQLSISRNMS